MLPELTIRSSSPASFLRFIYTSHDYLDVMVKVEGLTARKLISQYSYLARNGFIDFFQHLSDHERPWSGEVTWESPEVEMKIAATCDSLGHVKLVIDLRDTLDVEIGWALRCPILIDLGDLPFLAAEARRYEAEIGELSEDR